MTVKDNFLGMFNWGNDVWANFDIPLQQHELGTLKIAEEDSIKREKEIANIAFISTMIKNKTKTSDITVREVELKKSFRPV